MSLSKSSSPLSFPPESLIIHPLPEPPLKFSLVLPTYNESENIEKIISILTQLLDPIILQQWDIKS